MLESFVSNRRQPNQIMGKHTITIVLLIALLSIAHLSDAKRTLSGRRGGSSSSSSRRGHTYSSGHVTKPTFQQPSNSHADVAKLSYPNYNQQPNRPAQPQVPSAPAPQPANTRPIGWNVPPKQEAPAVAVNKAPVQSAGPPPQYTPHNVPGGAKTNINEQPPPYSAVGGAGVAGGLGAAHVAHQQPVYHQPNYGQPQSHGMYPQQTYHPSGGYPQAPPSYPGGAPQMYPAHGAPQMYPVGGHPVSTFPVNSQPVYQGAAIQPGFYPAGSMPVGAVQGSSGPGFGSGLLAGALGGAVLGHVLTPSGNSGSSDSEKVVIINNPPAQAAPAAPAAAAPAAPAAAAPAAAAPVDPAAAPAAAPAPAAPGVPAVVPPVLPGSTAPIAPVAPVADAAGNETSTPTPLAPFPSEMNNTNTPPPVYGLMCVPVMVNVTDPANPANITMVEQIACYNVTQPAAPAPPAPQPGAPVQVDQTQPQPNVAPAPVNAPPPPTQKTSEATISESAKLNNGAFGITATSGATLLSTIVALVASYCLH
ncbi:vegetative cell wall protein gp1-like isoform X3 [Hermetia illucens]|uniref:vegetative cell wall protein gp1-like isoform X3 n=1 Tax=Hermetia illucens TaxID=343691 RepID=UPI0018CC6926|nr:vegetative cell wall protein gp1-like isoform X3 [Hermetia illucens]